MAYDEILAARIRAQLARIPGLTEKKMFGGVAFMANGNMACGVNGDHLIVHVGLEKHSQSLAQPHTSPFDMTGKPMAGWIKVGAGGLESDGQLNDWIHQGLNFAFSLPPK